MDTSKATPDLYAALARAQAKVENATKGSTNPHFRSKYADLAEILNTVRPTFAAEGLAIIQSTEFDGSAVTVVTAIAHSTGGVITSPASCVPAKTDAQGIGAATTYLRRYGLAAMAGIAQEDDDGQAAAHDRKPEPKAVAASHPAGGVAEGLSPEEAQRVFEAKVLLDEYIEIADYAGAVGYLARAGLNHEEKVSLWELLNSKQRSAIKKAQHEADEANGAASDIRSRAAISRRGNTQEAA